MNILLILLVLTVPQITLSADYFDVTGSSPYDIGVSLGKLMNKTLHEMYAFKVNHLLKDHLKQWEKMSDISTPAIQKFAPISYEEMKGIADGSKMKIRDIIMLNTEYEISLQTGLGTKACTGFVSQKDGYLLSGQTDDDTCDNFLGMEGMLVQKRNQDSLIFTFDGYMAYMGMNSHGLTVLWQTVNNLEFRTDEAFVPTTVFIREMLSKKTIFEAISYLHSIPRGCPNNIIVTQPGEGYAIMENSPTNFSVQLVPATANTSQISDFCHSNHLIFNQPMMDQDTIQDPTSIPRLETCRDFMKKIRETPDGIFSVQAAKDLMNTPPIKRDGKWANVWSCSAQIYDPQDLKLFIKYYKEDDYHIYSLK